MDFNTTSWWNNDQSCKLCHNKTLTFSFLSSKFYVIMSVLVFIQKSCCRKVANYAWEWQSIRNNSLQIIPEYRHKIKMLQYFTRRRKDQQKQPSCNPRSKSRFQLSLGCVHCDLWYQNQKEQSILTLSVGGRHWIPQFPLSKKCNNGNFLNPNEPEKFWFTVK